MAQQAFSLEDRVEGVLVSSDLHGNYGLIRAGLEYANDNNFIYVSNGDIVNDYDFSRYAHDVLGLVNPRELQFEYLSKVLSEKDLQALMVAQSASQYGVEALMNQIPEGEKSNLEQVIAYSQSELFQKRVQKTFSNMESDIGTQLMDAQLSLRAFYDVFMDEEARRFAEELNKYNVKVAFNAGNHENAFFVEQVKQYLKNPDQIVDLTSYDGLLEVNQSNGQSLTLTGISNCPQFMPYLNEIFSEKELMQLYSHTFREKSTDLDSSLDILLTHGQIGIPQGIKNAYEVPYLESAKALSLEAKLTIEGHIHNQYEGKNSLGNDMIRAAGENAAIISKDASGDLVTNWVSLGDNYNGGSNTPISYDKDYMLMRIEDMKKQYLLMMEAANKNSALSDAKAA